MHLGTSQHITLPQFPRRELDHAIREPQNENDPQTAHHPQSPKKENRIPSLHIREEGLKLYTTGRKWYIRDAEAAKG
jgi:hypothetical protein